MCVVSMIMDHYQDKWRRTYPWTEPAVPMPDYIQPSITFYQMPEVSKADFDKLRADVDELIALVKRAKKYDAANNEPDCETEEKMDLLRKVAKVIGVDLDKELRA